MTTETVHDNHFDSFAGAGQGPVVTAATPAANRTFTAPRCRPTADVPWWPTRLADLIRSPVYRGHYWMTRIERDPETTKSPRGRARSVADLARVPRPRHEEGSQRDPG